MRKYKPILIKEIYMNSIADGSVIIQTFSPSVPSTPPWFGESHPTRNPTVRQSLW